MSAAGSIVRTLNRWIRPCFSRGYKTDARIDSGPARPGRNRRSAVRHAFNAPTHPVTSPEPVPALLFGSLALPPGAFAHQREVARFQRPEGSRFQAQKPCTRCLDRPTEWSFWTLLGATGGTQTHSRRTGRRLGQLHCARQGLVRVPESNTKYGGKRRKTGVSAAPVMGPSISESSGIPKRKKALAVWMEPSPRCSQGNYFFADADCA